MSSKVKLTSCQKCTFRGGHDFITVQRPSTEPMKQHHSVSTYTVDGACKPAKSTHDNLSMLLEKWSFRRDIHSKALSQILKNKGTHCMSWYQEIIAINYVNMWCTFAQINESDLMKRRIPFFFSPFSGLCNCTLLCPKHIIYWLLPNDKYDLSFSPTNANQPASDKGPFLFFCFYGESE